MTGVENCMLETLFQINNGGIMKNNKITIAVKITRIGLYLF